MFTNSLVTIQYYFCVFLVIVQYHMLCDDDLSVVVMMSEI